MTLNDQILVTQVDEGTNRSTADGYCSLDHVDDFLIDQFASEEQLIAQSLDDVAIPGEKGGHFLLLRVEQSANSLPAVVVGQHGGGQVAGQWTAIECPVGDE